MLSEIQVFWHFAKTVWVYEEVVEQATRLQNQLYILRRDQKLSREKEEKELLDMMIGFKKAERARMKKMQKKLALKLAQLIKGGGDNLTTIPGISTILAAKIVSHTGGIERFKNVWRFIRYAGISPKEKSSGKTKKHSKSNTGNRKLNGTFYLCALTQICWNPKAKVYYQKKLAEGKTKKRALRSLMKQFATVVYLMLKSGEVYRPAVQG